MVFDNRRVRAPARGWRATIRCAPVLTRAKRLFGDRRELPAGRGRADAPHRFARVLLKRHAAFRASIASMLDLYRASARPRNLAPAAYAFRCASTPVVPRFARAGSLFLQFAFRDGALRGRGRGGRSPPARRLACPPMPAARRDAGRDELPRARRVRPYGLFALAQGGRELGQSRAAVSGPLRGGAVIGRFALGYDLCAGSRRHSHFGASVCGSFGVDAGPSLTLEGLSVLGSARA